MIKKKDIKRIERGWAGHFILSDKCRFRRNSLLVYNDLIIVVSTVGLLYYNDEFHELENKRYFETRAFHANKSDKRFFDADVLKQIHFDSDWSINKIDADDEANNMHERVVEEISVRLKEGDVFN